mmetsp:Transcript_57205/g.159210  ORF Transcript_57205/g.159210 Transcript_57205/m.159210 type:complete len:301 (-) Transcript_57205:87-989(-)
MVSSGSNEYHGSSWRGSGAFATPSPSQRRRRSLAQAQPNSRASRSFRTKIVSVNMRSPMSSCALSKSPKRSRCSAGLGARSATFFQNSSLSAQVLSPTFRCRLYCGWNATTLRPYFAASALPSSSVFSKKRLKVSKSVHAEIIGQTRTTVVAQPSGTVARPRGRREASSNKSARASFSVSAVLVTILMWPASPAGFAQGQKEWPMTSSSIHLSIALLWASPSTMAAATVRLRCVPRNSLATRAELSAASERSATKQPAERHLDKELMSWRPHGPRHSSAGQRGTPTSEARTTATSAGPRA